MGSKARVEFFAKIVKYEIMIPLILDNFEYFLINLKRKLFDSRVHS